MPNEYTADKYRAKTVPRAPFKTESFTRMALLKEIITAQAKGHRVLPRKFEEREITPAHREAIQKCAELWRALDGFEAEVKTRKS
jgi:hypothetical protein